ncbi:MAG: hypothetical protein IJ958_05160 [Agathobacter sp.]|nr:hypothetical protein [Agathobacter sp.]
MKKIYIPFLCVFMLFGFLLLPTTVYADIGPKPSVVVTFTGLEDENYYVTLISQDDSTGPYSYGNPYYDWMGEEWVFNKFSEYKMPNGYYFLSYMEDCSDDDTFEWGYYPPQEFRILIYFTDYDAFLEVDGDYERYAFDSYFTVDVTPPTASSTDSSGTVEKSYDFTGETISFIVRIICTIAVEILIALLFLYRDKKSLVTITIINVITQIVLNVLLNIFNYQSGPWAFIFHYVWMEIVIFAMEAFLYSKLLPRTNPQTERTYHPCWYAFVANIVSFILGMQIAKWIPGIF